MKNKITVSGFILRQIRSDMEEFLRCVDESGHYKKHGDNYGCSMDVSYCIGEYAKNTIEAIDSVILAAKKIP